MPQFSIIIPLYNKQNFIENTIKSVLNQGFTDFELIIVNDGSTDNSEEKVLAFKDTRIQYFRKENGGVSSARNFGIEKAKSDYIVFIDADDYWYPDFLAIMFDKINQFPEIQVFSAGIEVETPKKVFYAKYSIERTGESEIVNYFKASQMQSVICSSCAVFHKSVFEKTGRFDTNLKNGEDTDMWIRIGLIYPILFTWKVLVRYIYDIDSLSKIHKIAIESLDFSKYSSEEKNNPDLKFFLDLNRFSLAIKSKIMLNKVRFEKFNNEIDYKQFPLKKRIILLIPVFILKPLINLKSFWVTIGLGNSVFK